MKRGALGHCVKQWIETEWLVNWEWVEGWGASNSSVTGKWGEIVSERTFGIMIITCKSFKGNIYFWKYSTIWNYIFMNH